VGSVDQPLRWTATGLLEAEKKFRRIKGYQEILLLKERLNPLAYSAEGGADSKSRLNLVAGSFTVQNIESRCNQLKLGHPRSRSLVLRIWRRGLVRGLRRNPSALSARGDESGFHLLR
jgi:hypothetical protein